MWLPVTLWKRHGLVFGAGMLSVVVNVQGVGPLLGNYLVLDIGDGVYAVYAHLRRGSLRVGVGDRVTAGQEIAECGNSGNSSEPHLHFQLMDGSDVMTARGVPFEWHYRDDEGSEHRGVPEDLTRFSPGRPVALRD